MAETTETVATAQPETEAQAAEVEAGKDGEKFDAARAQALIDKLRAENKAAKQSAAKLAEYEAAEAKRKEAEMSELEKLNAKLKDAQEKIDAANRREMQRAAADKLKLPAALADRLKGSTAEEMEADAAAIMAALPKPATNLSATNAGNGSTAETDAQRRARLFG